MTLQGREEDSGFVGGGGGEDTLQTLEAWIPLTRSGPGWRRGVWCAQSG